MEKIVIDRNIPLIGCIAFGIIDRGTNLLQVRPTSLCNLNCIFCSTNAPVHPVYYEVDLDYLIEGIKEIVKLKGDNVLINFDSVGETLIYPKFLDLVKEVGKIKEVSEISMQTNGVLLTKDYVDKLEKFGMNRINLSINSLDKNLAKKLSGCDFYDLDKILEIASYINKSKIELLIAPVWLPNVNDEDIVKLIKLCKDWKCKIGIQKYEIYKYGRKLKEVKQINWWKFYEQLKKWEKELGVKLRLDKKDFKIEKRVRVGEVFKKNERVNVEIVAKGWWKEQMLGKARSRCISINNCENKIGDKINIRILETKNNLYVGEKII